MSDLIGRTLDRYQIVELVGEGGMATVYRAHDPRLKRDVAVKVMLPSLAANPTFRKRFEREAQSVANLRHPNILTVYDYGETEEGQLYLVVEYVPGGTLRDRLEELAPLESVVEIVAQVAEALDYAHQQGVIHRDVKPNNILLDELGRPLLADFGLVKPVEEDRRLTASGMMMGTPDYVAPEQVQGMKVDGRADIYALGVVLFELLTGRHPYDGETPMSVMVKHLTEPMPWPSQFNPQIPPALDEIVLKATAKSPDERYPRAGDMARALRATLASGVTPAPGEEPAQFPPPAAPSEEKLSPQETLIRYQQILTGHFDEGELRTLCFALGVEYEDLPGLGQADKSRELIRYLIRHQRLAELGRVVAQMRPEVSWPAVPDDLSTPWSTPLPGPTRWYRQKRVWAALGAFLTLLVIAGLLLPSASRGPKGTAATGRVPTARPGETMILIARFKAQPSSGSYDVSQRIYDKLTADVRQMGETEVSVYQVDQVVESSEAAIALGRQYGATTVIWGYYDDIGISPNVEAVGTLEDAMASSLGLERFNLDTGEAVNFKLYIAQDLPEELSFLTAVSLYQAFVLQGNLSKAINYLTLAENNLPQDPQFRGGGEMVYFTKSMLEFFQGDLDAAIAEINQAIAIAPDKALLYVSRAVAYAQLDQTEKALADLERAIELEPDNVMAYVIQGMIYWPFDPERARQIYDRITEMDPDEITAYYARAILEFEVGDMSAALKEWRQVETRRPDDLYLPVFRGLVYEKMGQSERAAADYAQVRSRNVPPDASIQYVHFITGKERIPAYSYLFECTAYQAWGDIQQAMTSCNRALEVDPAHFDVLWKRGQLHAAQQEWQAAVDDYSAAIETDGTWPWVYYLRAQALLELGRNDEAQADLTQALELNPVDELRQQILALRQTIP